MHNFFKKDDPINLAIAAVSFLVWIITKNSDWAILASWHNYCAMHPLVLSDAKRK